MVGHRTAWLYAASITVCCSGAAVPDLYGKALIPVDLHVLAPVLPVVTLSPVEVPVGVREDVEPAQEPQALALKVGVFAKVTAVPALVHPPPAAPSDKAAPPTPQHGPAKEHGKMAKHEDVTEAGAHLKGKEDRIPLTKARQQSKSGKGGVLGKARTKAAPRGKGAVNAHENVPGQLFRLASGAWKGTGQSMADAAAVIIGSSLLLVAMVAIVRGRRFQLEREAYYSRLAEEQTISSDLGRLSSPREIPMEKGWLYEYDTAQPSTEESQQELRLLEVQW